MTTVRRPAAARRPLAALLLLALAAPLAAQSPDLAARSPAAPAAPAPPTEQLAAMAKLRYMVGEWKGTGWIEMQPGQRLEFRGGERVQEKLGGLALLVEGRFTARPPGAAEEIPVHTTLAVLSFDPREKKYLFDTWLATGTSGDHELVLTEGGWYWELRHPRGLVRYTFTRGPQGEWIEVGERSADRATWTKFFEMTLRKEP
jgi:hypothetical protein